MTTRIQDPSRGFAAGCLTCRIRKVKCDQAQPCCQRCVSTGRWCDGYSSLPFTRSDLQAASKKAARYTRHPRLRAQLADASLISTLLCDGSFESTLEKRYFQFFRSCTIANTALTVHSPFWDRIVLQTFHVEPAIKHAVLAIGAIHNHMITNGEASIARQHLLYAEHHYVVGLREARYLIANVSTSQTSRVLIVCILFILWESMRGNYAASKSHMDSGRALLSKVGTQSKDSVVLQSHLNHVMQVFARLDISAMTFSDTSAPYQYSLEGLFAVKPKMLLDPFESVQQASVVLMDLFRWLLILGNELARDSSAYERIQDNGLMKVIDDCSLQFDEWNLRWKEWLSQNKEHAKLPASLHVQLWYTMAKILLSAKFWGPETRYDAYMDDFHSLIELAEMLANAIAMRHDQKTSFSLDLGYLVPAFFTAIHCRDTRIRWRAVDVLELTTRHEGAWQSTAAAVIARQWIHVEEDGIGRPFTAQDIKEERRIALMQIEADQRQMQAELCFHFSQVESAEPRLLRKTVHWDSSKSKSR